MGKTRVISLKAPEIYDVVIEAFHAIEEMSGHPHAGAIARRVAEKLGPLVQLSNADAHELEKRRGLDSLRREQLEELVARRNADFAAEDLKALAWLRCFVLTHAQSKGGDAALALGLISRMLATPGPWKMVQDSSREEASIEASANIELGAPNNADVVEIKDLCVAMRAEIEHLRGRVLDLEEAARHTIQR